MVVCENWVPGKVITFNFTTGPKCTEMSQRVLGVPDFWGPDREIVVSPFVRMRTHSDREAMSGGGFRRTLACFATLLVLQTAAAFGASGTCARRSLCDTRIHTWV